jgi:ketosteroid isomerase-like protein
MTIPDLVEVARKAYEAFASRDLETLSRIADPEIEIHAVTGIAMDRSEPYRGTAGISDYLADVGRAWEDIHLYPHEFIELDSDRVLVLGRARVRAAGTTVDTPNAWIWEFRDGLIVRVRVLGEPDSMKALLAGRSVPGTHS